MKKYYYQAKTLVTSATAKDTYILFGGNLVSAFLGFLFTIIIARGLTVSGFGIFSALNNLVTIVASVADVGISAGLINFVAGFEAKGENKKAQSYIKASLLLRFMATGFLALILIVNPSFIAKNFLAAEDKTLTFWVIIISFGIIFWSFFPVVLQAYKRFFASVVVDVSLGITRVLLVFIFYLLSTLTLEKVLGSFLLGTIVSFLVGLSFLGAKFFREKVTKNICVKILRFSGWVGVNKVISSVSGRLDIQMLAALTGATITGLYSISSRLALFIVVLASSFGAVLAPRLASFADKAKEKRYILKATLALVPITGGIIFWIIIARPFITILFGTKYLPAVPIFQALSASMIPFLFTVPSVVAIIYAMKKTIYIGLFSFFQLVATFTLNLVFIPRFGPFGPTITFAIVHTILALYTWFIVINYYWIKR